MSVRVVRLGSPRRAGEGLRIGTVRRPPRGVPKSQFARQNWYDVWFPNLAPSVETMKAGQAAATPAQWSAFVRKYKAEMSALDAKRTLELLAALSHNADFSVGCYCEDENHCHRSVLKQLLIDHGAKVVCMVLCFVLFAALGFASQATAGDQYVGTWTGAWDGAGTGGFELTIEKDKDGKLAGRVSITGEPSYKATLKTLAFDGAKMTGSYDFTPDDRAEVVLSASFEGTTAAGTWSLREKGGNEVASGGWKVKRD